MKNFFLSISFILFISSCSLNNSEIIERDWKYGNGFWIGDFPSFDNPKYTLRNDTIYVSGKASAIIIETDRNYIFYDTEIQIKSISTGEFGTYHDLGVRKK